MNFFEAQDQARKGSSRLILLFAIAVVGIVISLNVIAFFAVGVASDGQYDTLTPTFAPLVHVAVTVAALVIILGASLFKSAQLNGDGGKVARMLGGRLVDGQTGDADERKLLNIVEEMSLASGMPVPDVYVLEDAGINAFAAGTDVDSAAVGVTRGCIESLSRDELQGVVAHEFSHILNGDMKLNIRLIGVIFGILVIGLIGYTVFRYAPYLMQSGRSRSSNDKGGGAMVGIAILVVGGLIWLVGSVGVFCGRLIQASVSRKREYLADASAVQFTRNPGGIRDALRKIGGNAAGANVSNRHAGECAHMFFASGFTAMFATHPPLPQRIQAIDPQWDGTMLAPAEPRPARKQQRPQKRQEPRHGGFPIGFPAVGLAGAVDRVGQLDDAATAAGLAVAEGLPIDLRQAARQPELATAMVASLFVADGGQVRVMQDDLLAQQDPAMAQRIDALWPAVRQSGRLMRLPLIELAAPALRALPKHDGNRVLNLIRRLIEADGEVEPFEYALYKLLDRIINKRPIREKQSNIDAVSDEIRLTLSALASAGSESPDAAAKAYDAGRLALKAPLPDYKGDFKLPELDMALERLAGCRMPIKERLIKAAAATTAADDQVTVEEVELLRATAAVLGCPMPPMAMTA